MPITSEAVRLLDLADQAKALLAIAEVNADQRGSKKRDEVPGLSPGCLAQFGLLRAMVSHA